MWWVWAVACFSDPLSSVGLTPVAEAPPAPEPPPLEVPTTPPMDGEKITGDGAAPAADPAAPAGGGTTASAEPPAAKPPSEYNPISVPQGPRESGGVKWEGVSKRGANAPLRPANGSVEYEKQFDKN